MPTSDADVVVKLVIGIPSKYHITKAETLLQCRQKLIALHILAAHYTVYIKLSSLSVVEPPFPGDLPGSINFADFSCFQLPISFKCTSGIFPANGSNTFDQGNFRLPSKRPYFRTIQYFPGSAVRHTGIPLDSSTETYLRCH